MKVTTVKVQLSKESIVRGYVDIVLNDCWAIHNLKVIWHPTGLLVAMPSQKRNRRQSLRCCFPDYSGNVNNDRGSGNGGVHKEGYFQNYEIETVAPANESDKPKAIK